jgi:hypothetical protein
MVDIVDQSMIPPAFSSIAGNDQTSRYVIEAEKLVPNQISVNLGREKRGNL